MIRTILKTTMIFLVTGLGLSQVTFEISPRQLPLNRNLQFTIAIEGSNLGKPSLTNGLRSDHFKLISQQPNTSFSTSVINGQMTVRKEYTYYLKPVKQGTFPFPSQSIDVGGKIYKSPTVEIIVKPEENLVQSRRRSSPLDNFFKSPFDTRSRNTREPEIFAELYIPKKRYYMGEAIPLEVRLNTYGVEIHPQRSRMEWPDMADFWIEETPPANERGKRIQKNDKVYQQNIVGTRVLYANKAGKLTIKPVVFELLVSTGGFMADWQNVSRKTEPLTLHILPLPKENRPGQFQGAVGQFSLKSEFDRESLSIGETISMKLILSGKGNFSAIQKLAVEELGKDFDVFDGGAPQTVDKEGLVVQKTWVYALVPKNEGNFLIPEINFPYFDLGSKQYRTIASESCEVEVSPGSRLPDQGTNQATSNGLTIERADESLRFIKFEQDGWVHHSIKYYQPKVLYVIASFCLFGNLFFLAASRIRESWMGKQEGLRPKMAFKEFRNKIKKLKKKMSEPNDLFHAELSSAVMTYFGSKLQRSGQGLALDEIERALEKRGADEQLYQDLVICIESCDFARFTRGSTSSKEKVIALATEVIEQAEEVMR